ncbi:fish-egg lectin-like [Engraulis encrasicolus]|uniref:fish-egg lectin-like n=1 Tax=Engraulis encrasicolus TaxID=184585 RepID=UPI002FD48EE3
MVQIDAGRGQVFGVNRGHEIFTRSGSSWLQLPGKLLEHVTVGPAGVWGVSGKYNIFKLVAGDWVLVPGDQDIPGHLKYYSCGPVSCWGVSHQNNIYIRKDSGTG